MIGGAGPSVLSRGGNRSGERGAAPVDLVFFGGVTGSYNTGLLPVSVDESGQIPRLSDYRVDAVGGAYGGHVWRRTSVGIDYRGAYGYAPRQSELGGAEHAMSMDLSHAPTNRWQLLGRNTLGTSTRAFGGFTAPGLLSADYITAPTTEIFHNRIYYLQSMGYAGYRMNARSMVTLGGGVFGSRREASELVGVNRYVALAAYEKRSLRDNIFGVTYNYIRFSYPRAFGSSDVHGATGKFTRLIGRTSSFVLEAGFYRAETLGSETFTLNPVVAAVLGAGPPVCVRFIESTGCRIFRERSITAAGRRATRSPTGAAWCRGTGCTSPLNPILRQPGFPMQACAGCRSAPMLPMSA